MVNKLYQNRVSFDNSTANWTDKARFYDKNKPTATANYIKKNRVFDSVNFSKDIKRLSIDVDGVRLNRKISSPRKSYAKKSRLSDG